MSRTHTCCLEVKPFSTVAPIHVGCRPARAHPTRYLKLAGQLSILHRCLAAGRGRLVMRAPPYTRASRIRTACTVHVRRGHGYRVLGEEATSSEPEHLDILPRKVNWVGEVFRPRFHRVARGRVGKFTGSLGDVTVRTRGCAFSGGIACLRRWLPCSVGRVRVHNNGFSMWQLSCMGESSSLNMDDWLLYPHLSLCAR